MFGLFTSDKAANLIQKRIEKDDDTRMRVNYDIWYRTPERQEGAHVWVKGREMVMFASNEYLGLGDHPKLIAAAKAALDKWGTSTTGARLANGSRSYHVELERKLADFLGKESCLISAAGYLSCMAAPATFAGRDDLILVDRNVHSSLWSGIQLSNARIERFGHNDATDLESILKSESAETPKLIVVEGVYSMEGHVCILPAIVDLAKKYGAFIIMDDAHGFGVMGEQGRGTASHFGLVNDVDIICGSLSKSLSSTGGFVAGSKIAIEYLRTHSKQMIFSAAISPAQAAVADAALDIMRTEPEHLARLWDNTRYYKKILDELGVEYWGSQTPAVPIVIGNREKAYFAWKKIWDEGLFTVLSIAPAVPPGKDLIRTAVSARHTHEDIDRLGEAIAKALGKSRK